MTRSSRNNETRTLEDHDNRESQTRSHDVKPSYSMEYTNPLDVSSQIKKEGYSYCWAHLGDNGFHTHRVASLTTRAWDLVPSSRSTTRYLDPLGHNPLAKKHICHMTLGLMERPEIYCEQEEVRFNKINSDKVNALNSHVKDIGAYDNVAKAISSF